MPTVTEQKGRFERALTAADNLRDAANSAEASEEAKQSYKRAVEVAEQERVALESAVQSEKTLRMVEEHTALTEVVEAPATRTEAQTIADNAGGTLNRDQRHEVALRELGMGKRKFLDLDAGFARGFNKLIAEGMTPEEVRSFTRNPEFAPSEFRALSTVAASAGDTVPSVVERLIEPYGEFAGGLIDQARTIITPPNEIGNITVVKQTGRVTIGGTDEATEYAAESSASVDGVTLGAHKLTARTYISEELIASTATNLTQLVGDDMRLAMRSALENAVINGSTPAGVEGLIEASVPAGRTFQSGTTLRISSAEVTRLVMERLDPAFQANAVLLGSPALRWYISELRNQQGTREFTQTPAIGRAPTSFAGFGWINSSGMGGLTSGHPAQNQYAIVAGDFSRGYVIRRSSQIRLRTLTEVRAEYGQVVYLADTHIDGARLNERALAFLQIS